MNKEQIRKQLIAMKDMLAEMQQERIEASAVYSEGHWMLKDIDEDILLCSLTINDLKTALYLEKK